MFAQLRVDTIRERARLGLECARSQGRVDGRPMVTTAERVEAARRMRAQTSPATWKTIAMTLQVSSTSVRRALAQPADAGREHAAQGRGR